MKGMKRQIRWQLSLEASAICYFSNTEENAESSSARKLKKWLLCSGKAAAALAPAQLARKQTLEREGAENKRGCWLPCGEKAAKPVAEAPAQPINESGATAMLQLYGSVSSRWYKWNTEIQWLLWRRSSRSGLPAESSSAAAAGLKQKRGSPQLKSAKARRKLEEERRSTKAKHQRIGGGKRKQRGKLPEEWHAVQKAETPLHKAEEKSWNGSRKQKKSKYHVASRKAKAMKTLH